jgi:hypothetical protein|tara:strand:- start:741 stop:905 length:165 start_codon:yes stop_codon:yes gene_type:complete
MDLLASDIREISRPRDPVLMKKIENLLDGSDLDPPECDDMEEIEDALEDYGFYS